MCHFKVDLCTPHKGVAAETDLLLQPVPKPETLPYMMSSNASSSFIITVKTKITLQIILHSKKCNVGFACPCVH